MKSLAEFVRIMRYAQARLAVDWCQWRFERARRDLADAFDAEDRAWQNVQVHRSIQPAQPPEVPAFLLAENAGAAE